MADAFTMLDHLDSTLKNLLEDATWGLPELSPLPNISFATPDSKFSPSLPAINFFLYDVRENRELRTSEPTVQRTADGFVQVSPPSVRVDCSYLVTAWAADAATASEHALLGAVMRVLLRAPHIPARVLDGDLKQELSPLPLISLQPSRLQSIGEFWQATNRPKAVLNLTVTITVPPTTEPVRETIVTDRVVRMRVGTQEEVTVFSPSPSERKE